MKTSKRIETMQDIAMLDDGEFERFLPDLKLWHATCRATAEVIGVPIGAFQAFMDWTDDGVNELTSIKVTAGDVSIDFTKQDS